MDETRVLVAYCTENGSTRVIAEEIGTTLRDHGLDVTLRAARDVDSVVPYEAVILGSAVYEDRWQPAARDFVKRLGMPLRTRDVWLFSSGPLDTSADTTDVRPVDDALAAMAETEAHDHTTFGGRLAAHPYTHRARRRVTREGAHDYRDFEQIRDWSHTIAERLIKR
ncbi:flavodoxin domain-containing protein [Streptomyces sp. NPDC003077]|uniref:flavodoxin domain-containing protein n=1 Tax=Streptomyces sp. NPDC003077 TaxID=3154443 RepID=UPI0033AC65F7